MSDENGVFTSNEDGVQATIAVQKWSAPEVIGEDGFGEPVTIARPVGPSGTFGHQDPLLAVSTALHDRITELEARLAKLEGGET